MDVKIRFTNEPYEIERHGDMYDLRADEDVDMKAGDFKLISLGVAMELPKGYYAEVVPRSSTFKNFGVIQTNSVGIIDNNYCGNDDIWRFPALAMRDTHISKGDRICQFRLVKSQEQIDFNVVDDLGNENRNGFGSTGVK